MTLHKYPHLTRLDVSLVGVPSFQSADEIDSQHFITNGVHNVKFMYDWKARKQWDQPLPDTSDLGGSPQYYLVLNTLKELGGSYVLLRGVDKGIYKGVFEPGCSDLI